MTTNYCSSCGNKVELIGGAKPNFCSKCGQDLRTLTKTVASQKPPPVETEEDEDGFVSGNFDVQSLKDKIKISIDVDKPKTITVADVIAAAKANGGKEEQMTPRPAAKLPEGKDLLNAVAKECASSRGQTKEIE